MGVPQLVPGPDSHDTVSNLSCFIELFGPANSSSGESIISNYKQPFLYLTYQIVKIYYSWQLFTDLRPKFPY